jgi:hypothetical protein
VGLSRKKAAYLGLLGLGIAALAADRLLFTPSGAEASPGEVSPSAPAAPSAPLAKAEPSEPIPTGKPLSARLAQAIKGPWDDADVPDAFHSRTSWLAEASMGPPVPETPESKSENVPQQHKVTMIFKDRKDGHPAAILDRHQVKVGDTLGDGSVITSITAEAVELRGPSGIVNLPLRSQP